MEDGSIKNNTGGGVYVDISTSSNYVGTFIMKDGTIEGNSGDGAGVYVRGDNAKKAVFTMEDGIIKSNTGRGVYVQGTFTMQNGSIENNTGGGVQIVQYGTFTMQNDSTIKGHSISSSSGGGVNVVRGTFNMQGGSIESNTASLGGGVSVDSYGAIYKTGGIIYGNDATDTSKKNTAQSNGAAVYVGFNTAVYLNKTVDAGHNLSKNPNQFDPSGGGGWTE
jgi:hypothetical protein